MKSKSSISFTLSSLLLGLFILLGGSGCAGYRLGSMLPPDIKTIHVPTFANETEEPFIESQATRKTIEALQLDGSLKIVDEVDADSILEVTITSYDIRPLAFRRSDRSTVQEYRIVLTVAMRLVRAGTNETIVFFPRVYGDDEFEFAGDFTTAKRQALPGVAEDLARDIVERVTEAWQ